jgi:hypothetical protein
METKATGRIITIGHLSFEYLSQARGTELIFVIFFSAGFGHVKTVNYSTLLLSVFVSS